MVEMAIGNCDRLVRLVNDILDFEKMESGRLPLNRAAVEAVDLLRRAADVAHSMAAAVHTSLQVKAGPAQVLADQERIVQVLNELVSNAIKFSPRDTVIRLGTQPAAEGEVCFVVEDQGRGILRRSSIASSTVSSRAMHPIRGPWEERGWDWLCAAALWNSTAAASGPRARRARVDLPVHAAGG